MLGVTLDSSRARDGMCACSSVVVDEVANKQPSSVCMSLMDEVSYVCHFEFVCFAILILFDI